MLRCIEGRGKRHERAIGKFGDDFDEIFVHGGSSEGFDGVLG